MKTTGYYLKSIIGVGSFFVVLFLAAGTFDYPRGWLFLAVSVTGALLSLFLERGDADLVRERSGAARLAKPWDRKILGAVALITVLAYAVAGLEYGRFHHPAAFGLAGAIAGTLLILAGQALFIVAKAQNRFFSSFARIQSDRGHSVCDKGLYSVIRHPGYAGLILSWIGVPLVTGSRWCIIPAVVANLLLVLRTGLEDRMLREELAGYADYAQRVSKRLVPGVW
jgi:protein-S-isoprenylcysteine O-methyltransferase Ste14